MKIGRMIFYDKLTGDKIVDTGEWSNSVVKKSIEQQISTYTELSERNIESFDVIELEYGQYKQDFSACNGYRVNLESKTLEFSYPDPNETEPSEPVYRKPLSEEVEELKEKEQMLNSQVKALSNQNDEISDVLQEVILMMM